MSYLDDAVVTIVRLADCGAREKTVPETDELALAVSKRENRVCMSKDFKGKASERMQSSVVIDHSCKRKSDVGRNALRSKLQPERLTSRHAFHGKKTFSPRDG